MTYFNTILTAVVADAAAKGPFNWVKVLIIAAVIGVIVGFIYVIALKSKLTSVVANDVATDYKRPDSFKLTESRESFLYTKTDREEKPQEQPKTEN